MPWSFNEVGPMHLVTLRENYLGTILTITWSPKWKLNAQSGTSSHSHSVSSLVTCCSSLTIFNSAAAGNVILYTVEIGNQIRSLRNWEVRDWDSMPKISPEVQTCLWLVVVKAEHIFQKFCNFHIRENIYYVHIQS